MGLTTGYRGLERAKDMDVWRESRNNPYDEKIVRNPLDILVSVFQLRRLEHTRDTHGSRPFFLGLASSFRFFLFQEQFGIVTGELLELNEEVSESLLEAVDVAVELLEGKDEGSDLLAMEGSMSVYEIFEGRGKESRDDTHIAT